MTCDISYAGKEVIEIDDPDDHNKSRKRSNGSYYGNYLPIGGYYLEYRLFNGTFDGQGHTVSGIRIYSDREDSGYGLFGMISENAVVRNVTLSDASIYAFVCLGGIAGINGGGTVTNCHVTNTVSLNGAANVGGIAGNNEGRVENCTSSAAISALPFDIENFCFGGIVGNNRGVGDDTDGVVGGIVTGNLAIGVILPYDIYSGCGAIAGYNEGGILANNYYCDCVIESIDDVPEGGIGCNWADVTEDDGAVPVVMGDANGDGMVDINDYNAIANIILNIVQDNFNRYAADMNLDGKIDISDYIAVGNIILRENSLESK